MKHFFILIIIITSVLSCKKEKNDDEPTPTTKNELEIEVIPYFGSNVLKLDSNYVTAENYVIQFFDIKFYMANFKNGSKSLASIAFFDYSLSGNKFLKAQEDHMNFHDLQFILGVDSVSNHSDPSAFPASNPLNILNAGEMHWDWNPGYIFVKIDAKIDTIPNDGIINQDHFISFHVGKDENSLPMSFSNITWNKINENLHLAKMKIDFKQFLQGPNSINLKTESKTHSEPGKEVLNLKIVQNFVNSVSFE
jgi:hypothetical protein